MDEDQGGDGRHQELSFGVGFGADGGAGGSRALQLSLPASLGMEPEDLQRIRDGLYAGSQQARQPPAKQRRTLTVGVAPAAAPAGAGFASAAMPAAALGAPARPALAARNAWRKQQAAPVRPPEGHPATAPSTPPPAGLPPLLPAGPTPVSSAAASGKQCLLRAPGPEAQRAGAERCLPDAGQYGGAAFRAGWAPNGVLAHAGGRASSAAHVVVRQLSVGARVAPPGEPADADSGFQQRQRKALEAALTLHMQHSRAEKGSTDDEDGDEDCTATAVVPRWRLRCRREGELRKLSLRYIELCNAAAAEVRLAAGAVVAGRQPTFWLPSEPINKEYGLCCACSCIIVSCAAAASLPARPLTHLVSPHPPCAPLCLCRRRVWSVLCCATRPPPGSCCTSSSPPSPARCVAQGAACSAGAVCGAGAAHNACSCRPCCRAAGSNLKVHVIDGLQLSSACAHAHHCCVSASSSSQQAARSGVDAAMEGQEAEGELQLDRLAAFKRRAQLRCGERLGCVAGSAGWLHASRPWCRCCATDLNWPQVPR